MDTIVAVSTAPGRSAIGVIRLSGPESLVIIAGLLDDDDVLLEAGRVTLRPLKPRGRDDVLDQALLTYFASPNSYTGEDVIEISCHGSPVILRQVIDEILRLGGRLAEPGEFTLRALSNRRLNLSQAVAIRDLINARTDTAARQAMRQLKGELSLRMQAAKEKLISAIVILESALEFVEDDLPALQRENIKQDLGEVIEDLARLSETFEVGHLLRDGFRIAIAGRPNVGKSSLFNRLVGSNRAIVTEIPGTTRDSLNESINISGIPVLLSDTAGVRDSSDKIEVMGVERSRRVMADADLVLVVVDGSIKESDDDFISTLEADGVRKIVVRNKSDLASFVRGQAQSENNSIDVSALTSEGLDNLRAAILSSCGDVESSVSSLMITDARHHDLLGRAVRELEESAKLLDEGASEELVVIGLHNALRFIGEITGETTTEDILTEIFSTFCIGK